jgi:hypothetical protein
MSGKTSILLTLIILAMGVLVAACAASATDSQAACDQAIAQAMAIDPGSDTVQSIDGAVAGCRSVEAWDAAAQRYPDAFGGQDPTDVALTRCAAYPDLATAPLCIELAAPN